MDTLDRGLAVAEKDDSGLDTELSFRLAMIHHALGYHPRAAALTRRTVEILTGDRTTFLTREVSPL